MTRPRTRAQRGTQSPGRVPSSCSGDWNRQIIAEEGLVYACALSVLPRLFGRIWHNVVCFLRGSASAENLYSAFVSKVSDNFVILELEPRSKWSWIRLQFNIILFRSFDIAKYSAFTGSRVQAYTLSPSHGCCAHARPRCWPRNAAKEVYKPDDFSWSLWFSRRKPTVNNPGNNVFFDLYSKENKAEGGAKGRVGCGSWVVEECVLEVILNKELNV